MHLARLLVILASVFIVAFKWWLLLKKLYRYMQQPDEGPLHWLATGDDGCHDRPVRCSFRSAGSSVLGHTFSRAVAFEMKRSIAWIMWVSVAKHVPAWTAP